MNSERTVEVYRTIVVDPPWEYDDGFALGAGRTVSRDGAQTYRGKIEQRPLPYESMSLKAIKDLHIPAAPDCRLFLWTTNRYLPKSFDVIDAWGFTYRQTLVWHKTDANLPAHVAPNSAEFILVCTKGNSARTATMPSAVIAATRYGGPGSPSHSRKRECFMDYFEQVSPGPYLEMFSRRARMGWSTWGNESLHGGEANVV